MPPIASSVTSIGPIYISFERFLAVVASPCTGAREQEVPSFWLLLSYVHTCILMYVIRLMISATQRTSQLQVTESGRPLTVGPVIHVLKWPLAGCQREWMNGGSPTVT